MSQQALALEGLCFIRDHGQDLKISKQAPVLASVLPTYGEGKKIFATMITLSKVTGMKRETVRNARRELQDKGLLEDITGDPDKQERTYRLTTPGYTDQGGQILTTLKVVPERTTPGPRTDHNIKQLDQEVDQADHQVRGAAPGSRAGAEPRASAG